MKAITLLLIPLIFLSSCSIDWNDEKDVKIAELEMKITDMNLRLLPYERNPLFDKKLFSLLEGTRVIENLT
jgi:hypothetical protein